MTSERTRQHARRRSQRAAPPQPARSPRVACRFRRGEALKFISHLDIIRTIERAVRRAGLPVAYSHGHNPRARISFASALGIGVTSEAELMAIELEQVLPAEEVKQRLNRQLPEDLAIMEAWLVPGYKGRYRLGDIDTAEYEMVVEGPIPEFVEDSAGQLIASPTYKITRESDKASKEVDLRSLVSRVEVVERAPERAVVRATARTGSQGGARPEEILRALGIDLDRCRVSIRRTALSASERRRTPPRREED
jgi:radical SAM-linked protein